MTKVLYVGGEADGLEMELAPDPSCSPYDVIDLAGRSFVALYRPARKRRRALAAARAAALQEYTGPLADLDEALAATPAPEGRRYE